MSTPPKSDLYTRAGITDLASSIAPSLFLMKFWTPATSKQSIVLTCASLAPCGFTTTCAPDRRCSIWVVGGHAGAFEAQRRGVDGCRCIAECVLAARRNGYDFAMTTELSHLPFADAEFDYVVSLDVLGHVGFEEKDAVLGEVKRVLRPGA